MSKLAFGSVKIESGAWHLPQEASIYRWPQRRAGGFFALTVEAVLPTRHPNKQTSIYRWTGIYK